MQIRCAALPLKNFSLLLCSLLLLNLHRSVAQDSFYVHSGQAFRLTEKGASFFAALPLKCMDKEFPYKPGITLADSSLVAKPRQIHPAFFGCFDWHSSVHGHWLLVKMLKQFPNMPEAAMIRGRLAAHLTAENIQQEMVIFKGENLGFERTYGWAWLLYLQKELLTWNDPLGRSLSSNMQPLADLLSKEWVKYLGKIAYPIRVGEHTNLAFGLALGYDYAVASKDTALQRAMKETAMRFYDRDKNCPVAWEPGGSDFLSPCLEEARLMGRLLDKTAYWKWLQGFLPGLISKPGEVFSIAVVNDRNDGKLAHLDGLNLSRSAALLEIASHIPEQAAKALRSEATRFLSSALPHVASGSYAGEHWLASFAVYALEAGY
ncbi:MAG: DUF2891 domain-containing protein [Niastella sp.]|nr:DUF2891 domain-containing protein [Niastella sp.]